MKETIVLNYRAFKIVCKKFPRFFISSALYEIISSITPYVGIYLSAQLLNELAGARRAQTLWMWVVLSLISAAILSLLHGLSLRFKNIYVCPELYQVHEDIFRQKRLSMDYCVSDSQSVRNLRSQMKQNVNFGGWGLYKLFWIFQSLIKSLSSMLAAIALTFSLFTSKVMDSSLQFLDSPWLSIMVFALIFLIVLVPPLLVNITNSYYPKLAEAIKLENRIYSFFSHFSQSPDRTLDMRIYEQNQLICDYFKDNKSSGLNSIFDKLYKGKIGLLRGIGTGISHSLNGIIYTYVCLKSFGGAFGIGSVTQYVAATMQFSSALGEFLQTLGDMKSNVPFLKTCFEYLDTPNKMYQGSLTTEKRNDRNYDIEFRNVSFQYPDTKDYALRHVSLTFKVGEKLAIVGENGSGKTTFIKLLCRLYDPTEGEILLNGIDIRKYKYEDYLEIFSVVFQDFKLLAYSLAQNVSACTDYDLDRVLHCLDQAGFTERLQKMPKGVETSLYTHLDQEGVEISGGEAQKIAIARAIYKNAPFIILDEPTAALDPLAEAEIYSKFNHIVTDRTAIYISHRLSSCKFCDNIVVFDQGGIVEHGTHDRLLSQNGKYHKLWQAQAQYYAKGKA